MAAASSTNNVVHPQQPQISISLPKYTTISFIRSAWVRSDGREGIMVLSVEWILDSLDAEIRLPKKYYTITGVRPTGFNWSMSLNVLI